MMGPFTVPLTDSASGPGAPAPQAATTDRFMLDCIHANLHSPPVTAALHTVGMAAGYVTGDTVVRWTEPDWQYIASLRLVPVTIDQGFTGSPVPTANVRDVEQGAWSPTSAVNTAGWSAARPTIYAARSDMTTIVNELEWTRDIWLSWPLDHIPTKAEVLAAHPEYAKANLIGVQCGFAPEYDKSVIYDPAWPKTGDPMPDKKPITTLPDGNFDGPVTCVGPAGGEQYIQTWDPATGKWTRVLWPVPRG